MKRTIAKLSLALLSSLIGIGNHQPEANAQQAPACPASGTLQDLSGYAKGCSGTPSYYGIRIFEMGLCTSDPLAGSNFDPSSCTKTYENPTAGISDLAGNAVVDLTGGTSLPRIANGTYSYPYIRISNEFLLRSSYALTGGTYHSTTTTAIHPLSGDIIGVQSKQTGTAETYTDVLKSFGDPNNCKTQYTANVAVGALKAVLIDSNTSTVSNCNVGTAQGLVGVITLSTPIVIEEATQGLQVSFQVTNSGMTVIPDLNGAVGAFGGGAFSATFAIY